MELKELLPKRGIYLFIGLILRKCQKMGGKYIKQHLRMSKSNFRNLKEVKVFSLRILSLDQLDPSLYQMEIAIKLYSLFPKFRSKLISKIKIIQIQILFSFRK